MTDYLLGDAEKEINPTHDFDTEETLEWLESLEGVVHNRGTGRARFLLYRLIQRGFELGIELPYTANTPYINTIPVERQPVYPGDRKIEQIGRAHV